jgi:two-component system NtrC family sensor kinase
MRDQVSHLETIEIHQSRAEQQAESLAAIGELVIKLAAAPIDQDLWELIAESLKPITGALATLVTAYDPATRELVVKYIAASDWFVSMLNRHLGQSVVGFRVPVSPEMHRRMLAKVWRTVEDMSNVSLGTVPPSVAATLQSAMGIDRYASLALHHAGELIGTAVMGMPKNHPVPSADLLQTFAHLAAVSLRRKQTEEALRESEELYRTLVETSPDGIMMMDLDANILTANRELAKLMGWDCAEELVSRNGVDFLAPEEHHKAADEFRGLLTRGLLRDREYQLVRKDGSVFPAEISASLILDAHGNPRAMIGIVRDIAERKQMEEAMQRRACELDMLHRAGQGLNASLDMDQALAITLEKTCTLLQVDAGSIWLVDPETGELVCHSAIGPHRELMPGWRLGPGEGLVGWVAHNGHSTIVPDVQVDNRYHRDIEQKTGLILRSFLGVPLRVKEGIIGAIEVLSSEPNRFLPTDLALLESVVMSAAIALENARLYRDLQQRMEELQRTQAQLIQSAKMAAIGELAAGVAHELNNPLTAVLGFSELLLEHTEPDDPNWPRLEAIARQAIRARDIVANLLSFSRQTEFHREISDLNQVLQDALGLIRLRLKISGIVIREHYAMDLPPILMDTGRMKQVFLNIITNALHAMPKGGKLTVSSEQVGDEVAARVADTGEGIAAEHLPNIFEPFFTTRSIGKGSGLGLSVGLGIVQDHGGRIEVETQVGNGSTFTVWLPVHGETGGASRPATTHNGSQTKSTGTPPGHH